MLRRYVNTLVNREMLYSNSTDIALRAPLRTVLLWRYLLLLTWERVLKYCCCIEVLVLRQL